jgi:hypothetical protein
MMGSSIKNSNVEVTINQNPVEALRSDLSVVQSSHKGLIKNTGVTGHGKGLLCQGLSLEEAQALFNANDHVSEADREVINASVTRINTDISVTNDNEEVDLKLHNSPKTSEVLSDSLFNAGILSGHQFSVEIVSSHLITGNLSESLDVLSSNDLKADDLSESHVHTLLDSHASVGDDLSLSSSDELTVWLIKV